MIHHPIYREISKNMVTRHHFDDFMDCLRANLELFVAHKDITLKDMAADAGISMDTLKSIIYGKTKDCKLSNVLALSRVLGVTIDELIGELEPKAAKSLRIYRSLPERSQRLIDWHIAHQEAILQEYPHQKIVTVMRPRCATSGNLKPTHEYEAYDVSNIGSSLQYRVFYGIKIPCEHYMPHYSPEDILLIANDRDALPTEHIVLLVDGNLCIARRIVKDGVAKYYGIRDGRFRADDSPRIEILGYVAAVR